MLGKMKEGGLMPIILLIHSDYTDPAAIYIFISLQLLSFLSLFIYYYHIKYISFIVIWLGSAGYAVQSKSPCLGFGAAP